MDDKEEHRDSNPVFDPTLPGRFRYRGMPHPLLAFQRRTERILLDMGFSIDEGTELESLYDHDLALNSRPAGCDAAGCEPFRLDDDYILRTWTFPALIRAIRNRKPPLRIAACGKVHGKAGPDSRDVSMGIHVEAILIDTGITFSHVKGTVEGFLQELIPDKRPLRFRSLELSYASPSMAVDMHCFVCQGGNPGCALCRGRGRIEILRAGLVDPQVFKQVNIDPEKYSGFVFGMDVDRAARLLYRIDGLGPLLENEIKIQRRFFLP